MLEKLTEMQDKMIEITEETEKFVNKGNKAAGKRARIAVQDLKKMGQELRVMIQEKKNEGK